MDAVLELHDLVVPQDDVGRRTGVDVDPVASLYVDVARVPPAVMQVHMAGRPPCVVVRIHGLGCGDQLTILPFPVYVLEGNAAVSGPRPRRRDDRHQQHGQACRERSPPPNSTLHRTPPSLGGESAPRRSPTNIRTFVRTCIKLA